MRRKMGLFVPILLIVAVFFFLLVGISILAHAPSLAANANETAAFRAPVVLGWLGVALGAVVLGALAAAGMVAGTRGASAPHPRPAASPGLGRDRDGSNPHNRRPWPSSS